MDGNFKAILQSDVGLQLQLKLLEQIELNQAIVVNISY